MTQAPPKFPTAFPDPAAGENKNERRSLTQFSAAVAGPFARGGILTHHLAAPPRSPRRRVTLFAVLPSQEFSK